MPVDLHDPSEDLFADTRMSFGEHIEERFSSASEVATAFERVANGTQGAQEVTAQELRHDAAKAQSSVASRGNTVLIAPSLQDVPSGAQSQRRASSLILMIAAGVAILILGAAGAAWRAQASSARAFALPTATMS